MIKCLIVEDEKSSQELLVTRIKQLAPEITVAGITDNVRGAVDFLKKQKVDLVFLDNHIKGGRGMDVLSQVPQMGFEVIFSTAYADYAVEALNFGAVYYLLKPFSEEEFMLAVQKAITRIIGSKGMLVIGQGNKKVIHLDELMYIQSEGAYTIFVLKDKRIETSSRNLGYFEQRLPADRFLRVHHSYIVNISFIERVERGESLYVLLSDGETRIQISQRRSRSFFERMNVS